MSHGVLESANLPATAVAVGVSPFIYRNTTGRSVIVFISGGTVTTIEFSRDQANWTLAGLLAGQYMLAPGDSLRVSYAVAPTMTMVPA